MASKTFIQAYDLQPNQLFRRINPRDPNKPEDVGIVIRQAGDIPYEGYTIFMYAPRSFEMGFENWHYVEPIYITEGYRVIKPNETVEEGDLYLNESDEWVPVDGGSYGKYPADVIIRPQEEQVETNDE